MGHINTKKYRGSRTCGGGTHKNRRGAGNRGGRGRAGANKHHFIVAMREGFRKGYIHKGFRRPAAVVSPTFTVNVGELDELVDYLFENEAEYVEKEGDLYKVNLTHVGFDKVLGSGKVTKKLSVTAPAFSASAAAKIEEAGGECIECDECECCCGDEESEEEESEE